MSVIGSGLVRLSLFPQLSKASSNVSGIRCLMFYLYCY